MKLSWKPLEKPPDSRHVDRMWQAKTPRGHLILAESYAPQAGLVVQMVHVPGPPNRRESEPDDRARSAWGVFLEARGRAAEEAGVPAGMLSLTKSRVAQLKSLLRDYGEAYLETAWSGIVYSDYHMGRGKYAGEGPRLLPENLWTINSKINQVELLHDLAKKGHLEGAQAASKAEQTAESACRLVYEEYVEGQDDDRGFASFREAYMRENLGYVPGGAS